MTEPPRLCLASHSPRRRALLERLGVSFFVQAAPSHVEEEVSGLGRGREAQEVALARAAAKGRSVARAAGAHPVLSADTVVHLGDEILDKPRDAAEARRFLTTLSGTEHGVVTAVWLGDAHGERAVWSRTWVEFATLSPELVEAYIATGEPFDKAGGYGIQGLGGVLVRRIRGCYFNVVGLPLHETSLLLTEAGVPWALRPR